MAVKTDAKTGHDIAYVTRGHASGCTGAMAYYWQKVRAASLTPEQLATPLMKRPYDLRHSGITWRLNSGVPATEVAAWADALLVEPLRDLGLHRFRDTQGCAAAPFPGAWRVTGAGVVGHGACAAGGVAAGDVRDVVAGSDVGLNGHGVLPAGCGARWGGHGHRVMHRYKRSRPRSPARA